MKERGLVVSGIGSGSGKTLVTMALLTGLADHGFSPLPFKCGPDFIDPRHHEWCAGTPSYNLDLHFSKDKQLRERYDLLISGSSGGVVEGVMGLFDGEFRGSSTYDIVQALDLPIVLVLSAQGMAETVSALIKGVLTHRPGISLLGVIATRTGSDRHRQMIAESLKREGLPPLLGVLPRDQALELPERHLGLSAPSEKGSEESKKLLEALKNYSTLFDWSHINKAFKQININSAPPSVRLAEPRNFIDEVRRRTQGISHYARRRNHGRFSLRIGVALDEAFWFYYPENWETFGHVGIEVEFFSPLRDGTLPTGCDGIYLGGGYPELFANELASNRSMINEIRTFCDSGQPVYAECGGMLYLSEGPTREDQEDDTPFVGILPVRYTLGNRLKRLGYAEVLSSSGFFSDVSDSIRGHLFHYTQLSEPHSSFAPAFRHVSDNKPEGYCVNGVIASYLHLFFPSNISWAYALAQTLKSGRMANIDHSAEAGKDQ